MGATLQREKVATSENHYPLPKHIQLLEVWVVPAVVPQAGSPGSLRIRR